MIGASEGRPCAHWNGAEQFPSSANMLKQSDIVNGSPNLMAPVKKKDEVDNRTESYAILEQLQENKNLEFVQS